MNRFPKMTQTKFCVCDLPKNVVLTVIDQKIHGANYKFLKIGSTYFCKILKE